MGDGPGREPDLLDYLGVLRRQAWLIAAVVLVALAAALVVTLRQPKMYEASTRLLAPREGSESGLLGLAAAGLLQQIPALSVPSLTPNRDVLTSVLKSRTVADALVQRFGLRERYDVRFVHDARHQLEAATRIGVSKEGVIEISVEDTEPETAAALARAYVEELERTMARLSIGEAGRQRRFLTEQVARARTDLEKAEDTLRRFQERNRAVVLQEQARGAIDVAARLKGEIMAAEVQAQVLRSFATDSNPEVVALRRRIEEMTRQLAQMQYGGEGRSSDGVRGARGDFSVPVARMAEVSMDLLRLTREVKVQETLLTLLVQQLDQVKLVEAKDVPLVQVLDTPTVPERPSRPRVIFILALTGVGGLVVGVASAFAADHVQGLRARRRG